MTGNLCWSMVVRGQRALDGRADLPVVPDDGVEPGRALGDAQSPAGARPPWRSRPSWFFRVQMIASTRANAITAWTTEYLGLAVEQLRSQGRLVDDTLLTHLSPAQSDSIGLIGTITVDIDHELAQLDPTGHRPLREPHRGRPGDISPCEGRTKADRRPTTTDEIGAVVPSNRATTDLDPASGGTASTAAGQDQTQPQPKGNREDEAH